MPFPNFHSARVRDPNLFSTCRTVSIKEGISLIYCQKKDSKEWAAQAYRFDKNKFTPVQAKTFLEEEKIEFISFEKATKSSKKDNAEIEIDPKDLRETTIEFVRKDVKQHIVSGIILVPDEIDADKEFANEAEIEQANISYMGKYASGIAGSTIAHTEHISIGKDLILIENYIAPKDLKFGEEVIKKGSWIQSYKVFSADIWDRIESGEIKGFSIGAELRKIPIED